MIYSHCELKTQQYKCIIGGFFARGVHLRGWIRVFLVETSALNRGLMIQHQSSFPFFFWFLSFISSQHHILPFMSPYVIHSLFRSALSLLTLVHFSDSPVISCLSRAMNSGGGSSGGGGSGGAYITSIVSFQCAVFNSMF